jgi:hypothetical protein
MIRSHVVGDKVQDQAHTTRREGLPGAGERASSTEMIIDNIAADAVGRSHKRRRVANREEPRRS